MTVNTISWFLKHYIFITLVKIHKIIKLLKIKFEQKEAIVELKYH